MKVTEIFTSIQGESSYAGMPCRFIRLSGCNLRCSYCDTKYAYDEGNDMNVKEIMKGFSSADEQIRLVEITGGEPMLQAETPQLISSLADAGFTVLIETNGSIDIQSIDKRSVVIMDIKTPGSGMDVHNRLDNLRHLKSSDEVKFVITNRDDYEWARGFISGHLKRADCSILFSPSWQHLNPAELAGWILADGLPVRLNMQIHKIIYGTDATGV